MLLTYWNTVAFQALYARTAGWAPGDPAARRSADRPVLDRWALSEAHRLVARGHRGAGGLRHPARRARCSRRSSTTCPTGTSAAPAAASGTATRPRWRPCTSASYVVTLLMAPFTPFITERVWQDLFAPTSRRAARLGAPRGLADGRRQRWSTTSSSRRWRWSAGWSSSAGRPGPRPRCGPGSRCAGRWSRAAGWDRLCRRAARARSPRSSTSARSSRCRRPAATWSTTRAKGNFRALGKRFGKQTPGGRRGDRRRRRRRAGRRARGRRARPRSTVDGDDGRGARPTR